MYLVIFLEFMDSDARAWYSVWRPDETGFALNHHFNRSYFFVWQAPELNRQLLKKAST